MSTPQAKTKYYEQRFVNDFYKELERNKVSLPVTIVLKDNLGIKQVIQNVSGVRVLRDKANAKSPSKIKSEELGRHVTSKADIALFTEEKNGTKVDVAWISHKSNKDIHGKKITHAQYLDASSDVMFKTKIGQTKEIKDFKNKMISLSVPLTATKYCWPKYKSGTSLRIWDDVKSTILMNMAIFGVEFGKAYSRNNANILMVGDPLIEVKDDKTIILTTKENGFSLANGFAEYIPSKDKPIFFTKPTSGKKTVVDGKTIEGVSVWIIYRSYAGSKNRKIDDVLKNKIELISSSCSVKKKDNVVSIMQSKKITSPPKSKKITSSSKSKKITSPPKSKKITSPSKSKKITNFFMKK